MACTDEDAYYCNRIDLEDVFVFCEMCSEKLHVTQEGNELKVAPCLKCTKTMIKIGYHQGYKEAELKHTFHENMGR